MWTRKPINEYDFQPTTTTYLAAAITTAVVMGAIEGYQALSAYLTPKEDEVKPSAYKSRSTLFNHIPDITPESDEPTLFNSFGFGSEQ